MAEKDSRCSECGRKLRAVLHVRWERRSQGGSSAKRPYAECAGVNKLSLGLLAVTLVLMTAGVMFAASALTGANQGPDAGGQVAADAGPTPATTDWRIPNPKDAASANAVGEQPTNAPVRRAGGRACPSGGANSTGMAIRRRPQTLAREHVR